MGLVYAEITLINAEDMLLARQHIIGEDEVKQMTVNALVDTGAYMLCINENIQEQLQLPFLEKRKGYLADRSIEECDVVGPLEVKFKNHLTIANAIVLPRNNKVLINAALLDDKPVKLPYMKLL